MRWAGCSGIGLSLFVCGAEREMKGADRGEPSLRYLIHIRGDERKDPSWNDQSRGSIPSADAQMKKAYTCGRDEMVRLRRLATMAPLWRDDGSTVVRLEGGKPPGNGLPHSCKRKRSIRHREDGFMNRLCFVFRPPPFQPGGVSPTGCMREMAAAST
eukprot:scaffold106_cov246-Pinguiococcus_pyrenoidosus.AAC.27